MHILVISSTFPAPPNAGDKIRLYNFLHYLGSRHKVTLVTYLRSEVDDPQALFRLEEICHRVVVVPVKPIPMYIKAFLAFPTTIPAIIGSYPTQEFRRVVRKVVGEERFDVAFIYQLRAAVALPDLGSLSTVLDYTDALYTNYRDLARSLNNLVWKLFYTWESRKLQRYEKRIGDKVGARITTSPADARAITDLGLANCQIIPIGVDMPVAELELSMLPGVLFIGNPKYLPNKLAIDFIINNVWPGVQKIHPEAKLYIVGKNTELLRKTHAHDKNIIFTGAVKDVNEIYRKTMISLNPIFSGSGIKTKVLEAMARQKVTIVTTKAINGIDVQDKKQVLVADQSEHMVRNIDDVLVHPEKYVSLRRSARQFVGDRYNNDLIGSQLEQVLIQTYNKL